MMDVSQIAARMELPEERVAQIVQMVKTQGMDEAQMGSMMRMATAKGLAPSEIAETMHSLGLPLDAVLRALRAQDLATDDECAQIRDRLEPPAVCAVEAPEAGAGQERDARRARWIEHAKKAGVIVFWLAVWEALDHLVDNRLLLAGPVRTLQALAEQVVKPDFWAICGASFGRIALGFFLALAVGFALAMLCYRSKVARRFVDPIISLLKTIPMASFIILLLIWVGTQALTVYLAFLIVIPIIYTNVLTGFESVNAQMLEMARVHKLSAWRTFAYVYRPAFMPFLHSSCKLSLGMSWKAGIMAEVLAVPAMSIGKEMYTARTFLDTPDLLAWTVVVMVLSLVFEKLVLWALGRAQRPCGAFLGVRDDAAARRSADGAAVQGAGGDAGAAGIDASGGSSGSETGEGSAAAAAPALAIDPAPARDLVLADVRKAFGANEVLAGVDFTLPAGQARCLMAPSGSGKTTLFRVMLGLESADAGTVAGCAAGNVAVMFQEDRLCEALTPVENVLLLLPRSTSRAAVGAYLAEILPAECLSQPVRELSGGMRRRVALARAVAYPGALVVLDEPFTGLDAATRRAVIEFILRHRDGRTLLVATHGEEDARLLGAARVDLSELNGGTRR